MADLGQAYADFLAARGAPPAPEQPPASKTPAPAPAEQPGFFASLFGAKPAPTPPAPPTEHPLDGAFQGWKAKRPPAPTGQVAGDVFKDWAGGTFQRTLDGDTLDLSSGTRRTPTRLAGIDAPESAQGAWGPAAQAYLDQLVADAPDGKLRVGSRSKDKRGRDVATLYAGDKNVNVEMVRAGHARVYTDYLGGLSKDYQEQLLAAQGEAQAARKGMWEGSADGVDPAAFRHSGAGGGAAAGHDMRDPLDPATRTVAQSYWEWKRSRGEAGPAGSGGVPSGPTAPRDYRPGELYQPEQTWLDKVLGALDYAGNIVRSGEMMAVRGAKRAGDAGGGVADMLAGAGEGAWKGIKQAAGKERRTTATQLRDEVSQGLDLGKLRFGKDDEKFQAGDVLDFAADVVTDVAYDPLTWVTAGFSELAKGGTAVARMLPKLHVGSVESKLGLQTAAAAQYQAVKRATGALIGANYGYGTTDPNDSLGEKLLATAIGGAVGAGSGKALDATGKLFRRGFDKASDSYAEWTRGSRFANFTTARELALGAYEKVRNVAEWIRQGRYDVLDGLDDAGKIKASELMKDLKSEFVQQRNAIVAQVSPGQTLEQFLKDEKNFPRINQINKVVTDSIEKTYLPALLDREEKQIADAVVAWGKHNDEVVSKLNREVFGIESGKATSDGKGLFGVRWHIDDVYEKSDLKAAQDALGRFQIHAVKAGDRSVEPMKLAMQEFQQQTGKLIDPNHLDALTSVERKLWNSIHSDALDKTYAAYTENFGKKFLNEAERKASALMFDYSKTAAQQAPIRGLETMLSGFDKTTNFIKANMLYFSSVWIKNNYFDNLAKSWVENGLHGIVDAATFGKTRFGVTQDVKALYNGTMNRVYKNEDIQDALARGVLDNPMFKSMLDKSTRAFMYTPEQIKAVEQAMKTGSFAQRAGKMVERAGQIVLDNPYTKMVASVGSHMEGTARMMTYIRVKEAIEKSPIFKGATPKEMAKVKDIAAQVVKRTFFDYGDVTHFEKAVFQRLIPFYSFYSKNLPYWIQAATDPARAGRVVATEHARRNIGKDPSEMDRSGLPPYLAAGAPRRLGRDEHGNKVYGIMPGSSMNDALNMMNPMQLPSQAVDKGSTIIKAGFELASGRDTFAGGALLPTEIAKEEAAARGGSAEGKVGKKFLYSRGFKHYAIKKAAEALGMSEGDLAMKVLGVDGVQLDKNGNPFTTSDSDVLIDKVVSTLWPKGLFDQLAGSTGKVAVGKETLVQALVNRISPIQQVALSPAMERMVRNRKEKEGGAK